MFFVATFLRPVSVVFAQTPTSTTSDLDVATNPATTGEVAQDYEKRLMTCNITSGPEFVACFVWAFYYLVLYPSGKLAEVTAALLDFFIAYSLDSNSYVGNNGDFIGKGWSIIRDIANVSFIFILLYIAIRHILQMGSSNTKKLLVSLIIAALLINFSMFFSKIVIDAGNVLARVFYNNIEIVNPPPDQQGDNSKGKAITVALAEHISPQKILSAPIFDAGNITAQGVPRGKMPNGYAFFILAIAAFINITVSLVFLSTFLLFAARTIGLWFMMIFSPIAFASIAIPGAGSFLGQFGWNGWKDNILKLSFMAPIFMFFLFLAIMFLQIALAQDTPANSSSPEINTLMGVLIPFIVIIVILKQAKKVAVDMSGEVGKALTGVFGKIAGMGVTAALGVATGGTALIGRSIIGAGAAKLAEKKGFQDWAKRSSVGRTLYKATDSVSKKDFDFRNTGFGRRSSELLGKQMAGAGFEGVSLGKGTTKGGYVQRMEAYQKEKEAFKEKLKDTDSTVQTIHVDANGNVFSEEQKDANGNVVTTKVTKSLIDAETEFLRVQNEAKRNTVKKDITYVDQNSGLVVNLGSESLDYEGWTKKKEKADKALAEAKSDYSIILRDHKDGRANDQQLKDATKNLADARGMVTGVKSITDEIEKNWKKEEKMFKGVQKAKNKRDTETLRTYAESIKPDALNWFYDKVVATGGTAARKSASANIRLAAEKEEKKAIAVEKKEDKKTN